MALVLSLGVLIAVSVCTWYVCEVSKSMYGTVCTVQYLSYSTGTLLCTLHTVRCFVAVSNSSSSKSLLQGTANNNHKIFS